ncbi:Gfo/Idh/MocA family protein [Streptomyces sp. NPDC057638]|uniref:Gfo/Idh/MocA family protein n=1 Tax=Streptomyces sp. NPDC057638 TaxID=3346190 RepID=UPI003676861E
MTKTVNGLRYGLFGAGPWARLTQAPALDAHGGVEFVGVWARREAAARELAESYEVRAYWGEDGVDALLADCDAAAFALPPDVQAPLAVRAAEAGRHLLLDKPVATTVEGARAVADAVDRAGVASVVFCTLRFADETAAWVDEQSRHDGWFTAHAQWLGSLFAAGSESPYAASPWRREKGGLWDVGPHVLSVLLPILGEVTEVTAAGGPDHTVHLVLRHASGASATVTLTLSAPREATGAAVELAGARGRSRMPAWSDPVTALRLAIDELGHSARTGARHACDVRFGLRLTEILTEAERQLG